MVWRICCGLLGVTLLADVAWFLLNAKKTPTTKGQQLLGLLAFVVIVVLLFASAGMFRPYHLMFLASLLFMLYVSVHNFVLLLVIGTEPGS